MEKEPLLTQVWEICTTVASEEAAEKLARALLELHLVACVQVNGPMRSLYRWKGAIQDDLEWKLTIKTSQRLFDGCWAEIRRIHPYEVPELLARPVSCVSQEYERWLLEQVAPPSNSELTKTWHLRIAGRPTNAVRAGDATILGYVVETLDLPKGPSPMSVNFENVADILSRYPNLHLEPDGAFTWGSVERRSQHERLWQLDGMIYDRENRIEYVELKGNCDRAAWEAFTQVLSGVECVPLVVQWIEQGLWISEPDFRKCIE